MLADLKSRFWVDQRAYKHFTWHEATELNILWTASILARTSTPLLNDLRLNTAAISREQTRDLNRGKS